MAERRYNEKELAAILRAAGEAQAKDAGSSSEADGLTLAEIAKLAAEVGIDPTYIDRAAQDLRDSPKSQFHKWGAPSRQVIERTIDGTFDDVHWEEAVAEMRLAFMSAGQTSVVGTSREWVGGTEFRSAHVSATPKNGKTRIRISLRQESTLIIGWMMAFMGSFFSAIVLAIIASKNHLHTMPVFAIVSSVILAIIFLTHRNLSKTNAKNVAMVHSLLDRMAQLTSGEDVDLAERLDRMPLTTPEAIDQTIR